MVTGKKIFSETDMNLLPSSDARNVIIKEKDFGFLKLTRDQKIQIYENILGKKFNMLIKNGFMLPEG